MHLVPFVSSEDDCQLVDDFYSDAEYFRIELRNWTKIENSFGQADKLWVDAGVDGIHHVLKANGITKVVDGKTKKTVGGQWASLFKGFRNFEEVATKQFVEKPSTSKVEEFIDDILDACHALAPKAITVPQLPHVSDVSRNKINWAFAKATAQWKKKRKFNGALILPIILTNQEQLNLKGDRNKRITSADKSFQHANASGYWVVDSTMSDLDAAPIFQKKRFDGVLKFNSELQEKLPKASPSIAGPYWGLNLISWAKGLVEHPAIGVGRTFQYHISGGIITSSPKVRIAIPPLRRWAIHSKLKPWLVENVKNYDSASYAFEELNALLKSYNNLGTKQAARRQIAKFYAEWYAKIEEVVPAGRKLALFQDFTAAYVLGNDFSKLPADEGSAKHPERVAEYFMMFCL